LVVKALSQKKRQRWAQEIVEGLNLQGSTGLLALVARAGKASGQFGGEGQRGAVLDDDPAEMTQGSRDFGWSEQESGEQGFQDAAQEGDGAGVAAFGQGLFGKGLAGEQPPEAGPGAQGDLGLQSEQTTDLEEGQGLELSGASAPEAAVFGQGVEVETVGGAGQSVKTFGGRRGKGSGGHFI